MADDQQAHHQVTKVQQAGATWRTLLQCWNPQKMAILYATTGTQQEVNLSPLWHALANAPKHTLQADAQAIFNATALQVGFSTYAPIITVALSWTLEMLSLCADSSTTLMEGVQLFNLLPTRSSTQALESLEATVDFDQIKARGQLSSTLTSKQSKAARN